MRIGVISDTHGKLGPTQASIRLLESLDVETVLHCGDIGTVDVVRQFHHWPTHFVLGNCDYGPDDLREAIVSSGQTFHDQFGDITLAGARIALLHSHDRQRFKQAINSGDYALVCYGHSHVAAIDRHDDTLVLNPGAIHRANPPSLAIVDLPALQAEIIPL